MTTQDGRATPSAKDDAIKVVQLACAEGEIIAADRDARIAQLRQASTQAEIDSVLGSLRNRAQRPVPPPGPMVSTPSTLPGGSRSLPFAPLIGGLVSVVAGIAVVVFLVNLLSGVDTGSPISSSPTPVPETPVQANVLSAKGFADLMTAVKAEKGTTHVFDATIYPSYAVLQLPVDRETKRQEYYYWDGSQLETRESFGRSSNPRIDLATISVPGMMRLVRQAKRLVEEPTTWYVIINAPDEFDASVVYAYSSNKFTEGGYISADASGKVIRKTTW